MSGYGMIFYLPTFLPLFQEGVIMCVSFTIYDTTCEGILNGSIGCFVGAQLPVRTKNPQ